MTISWNKKSANDQTEYEQHFDSPKSIMNSGPDRLIILDSQCQKGHQKMKNG